MTEEEAREMDMDLWDKDQEIKEKDAEIERLKGVIHRQKQLITELREYAQCYDYTPPELLQRAREATNAP